MTLSQAIISIGAIVFVLGFLLSALMVLLHLFADEDKKRHLLILRAKLGKRWLGRFRR